MKTYTRCPGTLLELRIHNEQEGYCVLWHHWCVGLIYHLSQWWFHNAGLTPVRPMGILPSILLGERHELLQTSWEVFWECLLNYTHAPWWSDILLEIHLTNIYNLEILKVHECHNFSFLLHYFSLCFEPFLHSFPPFDHSCIPESPCHPQYIHFAWWAYTYPLGLNWHISASREFLVPQALWDRMLSFTSIVFHDAYCISSNKCSKELIMICLIQFQSNRVVKRTHVAKNNFKIQQHFCFLRYLEVTLSPPTTAIKIPMLPIPNVLPS